MTIGGLFDQINSQPIWLQVVIGLVVFFVVLPLVLQGLFVVWESIKHSITPSVASTVASSAPSPDPSEPSNELLYQALCMMNPHKGEEQIRSFLKGKVAFEKRALKKNPQVARVIQGLVNRDGEDANRNAF